MYTFLLIFSFLLLAYGWTWHNRPSRDADPALTVTNEPGHQPTKPAPNHVKVS